MDNENSTAGEHSIMEPWRRREFLLAKEPNPRLAHLRRTSSTARLGVRFGREVTMLFTTSSLPARWRAHFRGKSRALGPTFNEVSGTLHHLNSYTNQYSSRRFGNSAPPQRIDIRSAVGGPQRSRCAVPSGRPRASTHPCFFACGVRDPGLSSRQASGVQKMREGVLEMKNPSERRLKRGRDATEGQFYWPPLW